MKMHRAELKLFGVRIWQHNSGKNFFWFRIFGYGFLFSNDTKPKLFSERNGFTKSIRISRYMIKWLP
jgi:hypothetical protein